MTLQINLPDEILSASPEEVRLAFAARLYALRRVSTGKAAQIAGVSRLAFLEALDRFGVNAFDLTPEEFDQDLHDADPHR